MGTHAPLVLASSSERRLQLLLAIGRKPSSIVASNIDETPHEGELPHNLATRLSAAKATTVACKHGKSFILAADTVVACGRRILPKANTKEEARMCLKLLSGRRHRVWGGVSVITPSGKLKSILVMTKVHFKRLSKDEIASYLLSCEWKGKAGGYAIQGRASIFIKFLAGSYSNVVGLGLYETDKLLSGMGCLALN